MPKKSKIPTGPDVTEILWLGQRAWIHRQRKTNYQKSERGPGMWRAKIEGYDGDVIYAPTQLAQLVFARRILKFIEALVERKKQIGKPWVKGRRRVKISQ